MNNGGLYKNVKMTLATANFMVLVAIGLLVFCFCIAVVSAEKTSAEIADESHSIADFN
ncbi:MAG: hypothetical protein IKM66_00870 [Clostridia bacterium]|nr:hypothetical protein [Clostridia bacterium]